MYTDIDEFKSSKMTGQYKTKICLSSFRGRCLVLLGVREQGFL